MDATLVIMAAGMGSRFGEGIKQLEPLGPNGEILMLYSIYDAVEAGFNKVIFITREELVPKFEELVVKKLKNAIETEYVFQDVKHVPEGVTANLNRTKPWGTAQAILECKDAVNEPFLVINADDYYGKAAFKQIYDYLVNGSNNDGKYDFCMAGFILGNTLSDNGAVTRGICVLGENDELAEINETENIVKSESGAATENKDGSFTPLNPDSKVSMNMWGFTPEIFKELEYGFVDFLSSLSPDDIKSEYLIPTVVDNLIKDNKAFVKVLPTSDKWFGVTYQEDKDCVKKELLKFLEEGVYPNKLF